MSTRYYAPPPLGVGTYVLEGSEAHHLLHVMRAAVGQQVTLFDGHGHECVATIASTSKKTVSLQLETPQQISREAVTHLTLAVALPKGDRQRWLVEKATELGVARIIPLITERSVARPTEKSLDRLRRTVIEASKQCGRNVLMEIREPQPIEDVLRHSQETNGAFRILANPTGARITYRASHGISDVIAVIGPEGGFTEKELALASEHNWQIRSLGDRVLRIETAALTIAACAIHAPAS